jgi:hypothetical protein
MKSSFREPYMKGPSRGGLIGALIGAIVSVFLHKAGDRPLKKAGKTALFSGAGFLVGEWLEKKKDSGKGTE